MYLLPPSDLPEDVAAKGGVHVGSHPGKPHENLCEHTLSWDIISSSQLSNLVDKNYDDKACIMYLPGAIESIKSLLTMS